MYFHRNVCGQKRSVVSPVFPGVVEILAMAPKDVAFSVMIFNLQQIETHKQCIS